MVKRGREQNRLVSDKKKKDKTWKGEWYKKQRLMVEWLRLKIQMSSHQMKTAIVMFEWVNDQRSAWTVIVISLGVIIIHWNRWVHSFHSKRLEAFCTFYTLSLTTRHISALLINACSNYSSIEMMVSYFIRNPLFESFQMRVHRLVSWCLMSECVRVLTGHTQLLLSLSLSSVCLSLLLFSCFFVFFFLIFITRSRKI